MDNRNHLDPKRPGPLPNRQVRPAQLERRPRLFVGWHPDHPRIPVYAVFKDGNGKPLWVFNDVGPIKPKSIQGITPGRLASKIMDRIDGANCWAAELQDAMDGINLESKRELLDGHRRRVIRRQFYAQRKLSRRLCYMQPPNKKGGKTWSERVPDSSDDDDGSSGSEDEQPNQSLIDPEILRKRLEKAKVQKDIEAMARVELQENDGPSGRNAAESGATDDIPTLEEVTGNSAFEHVQHASPAPQGQDIVVPCEASTSESLQPTVGPTRDQASPRAEEQADFFLRDPIARRTRSRAAASATAPAALESLLYPSPTLNQPEITSQHSSTAPSPPSPPSDQASTSYPPSSTLSHPSTSRSPSPDSTAATDKKAATQLIFERLYPFFLAKYGADLNRAVLERTADHVREFDCLPTRFYETGEIVFRVRVLGWEGEDSGSVGSGEGRGSEEGNEVYHTPLSRAGDGVED